ncbi:MAG: biotin/lipoyl-containing protein, partial [Bacillota bacterium]
NKLTEDDIYERGETLDFPNSVVEFFEGQLGQPYQGFPKELQRIILKGKQPLTERPGESLPAANLVQIRETLTGMLPRPVTTQDVLSYALYPKVFTDWINFIKKYGDVTVLDTPSFWYGLRPGEEIKVNIAQGKTLVIKLLAIRDVSEDGTRTVSFELNGMLREVIIKDNSVKKIAPKRAKADKANPNQIGANMSGTIVKVLVDKGSVVKKGMPVAVMEAMKMEITIQSPGNGYVKEIYIKTGDAVETEDLLLEISYGGQEDL